MTKIASNFVISSHSALLWFSVDVLQCLRLAFFLSLYPVLRGDILKNLQQFLSRLFPFQRGLIHSYWAPNFWALYAGFDRAFGFVVRKCCSLGYLCGIQLSQSNTVDGKVGTVSFSVLPEISSIFTILLMGMLYLVLFVVLFYHSLSCGNCGSIPQVRCCFAVRQWRENNT